VPPEVTKFPAIAPHDEERGEPADGIPTLTSSPRDLPLSQLVSVVRSPSRTMRPCRNLTSLTPAWPTELVGVRRPSMKKTAREAELRMPLSPTSQPTGAAPWRGCECPSITVHMNSPSEMSVFPVPHSAITAAPRASFQRFTAPIIASVCAGNGLRRSCPMSGEAVSSTRGAAGRSEESAQPIRSAGAEILVDIFR